MTIELRLISARVWSELTGRVVDGPVKVEVTRYPAPRLFAGFLLPAPWPGLERAPGRELRFSAG